MPTYADVPKTIGTFLAANWTATPLAFNNVPALNYAGDKKPLAEGSDPYVSVKVQYGETQNLEVGINPARRTFGNLILDFYSKKDSSTLTNQTYMDAMIALFEYKKISGIVFREMAVMQDQTLNSWFITPTMIRFHFDR